MAISAFELLACVAVIGILQLYVYREGVSFSLAAKAAMPLPGLRQGWVHASFVDLSDHQWRSFREGLPMVTATMLAFAALSRGMAKAGARRRQLFTIGFAILFLGVLHGPYLLHVLLLATANFYFSHAVARNRWGLLAVWIANCAVFLVVRITNGLPFSMISASLAFLDPYQGMLRWHISYNLAVLRMISFAADLHWAALSQFEDAPPQQPNASGKAHEIVVSQACSSLRLMRTRVKAHQPAQVYCSFVMYLAYVLYPPLYVAGPIITFNNFVSQRLSSAQHNNTARHVVQYALRWLAACLCMELLTHTLYFNAISSRRLWSYLETRNIEIRPLHYAIGSLWVLVGMWLKFTVIWRFFRLSALMDDIDPPENMQRCVCNNYDIEGFWRNWHSSYNQWLVRYMYIPLGGSKWRLLNVWLIFTFVAVWHDLEWKLLSWAWLMALFMAPEMAMKALAASPWMSKMHGSWLYSHLCAAAASLNILILMAANLVGFVVGVDGVIPILKKIGGDHLFMGSVLGTLFCAAHIMLAIRDAEQGKRNILSLLCPCSASSRGSVSIDRPRTPEKDDRTV